MMRYVLRYVTPRGANGWNYRWFRSPRALARFLKTPEVVKVISLTEEEY
jgi:hypothetical protein